MKKYREQAKVSHQERLSNMLGAKMIGHPKPMRSEPTMKTGGSVEGSHEIMAKGHKPKTRLDRYARGGKVKDKGRTTVNVIVAPGGDKGAAPPMPMPPPGAAPQAPMPAPRPPMPAPGMAGAPPMVPGAMPPMMPRKRGGRVGKFDAGAGSGEGRIEKTAHAAAK